MRPAPDQLRRILSSGILAPSAENKHFLHFDVLADSVNLFATDRASWADQPHRQMLALLSYGAVVENMALRSAELGFALTAAWLPNPSRPDLMADLRWTSAPASPPDRLCDAIEKRHTNRRFYRRGRLGADALAPLSTAANAVAGAKLIWLDDDRQRALALKAIRIAETHRFARRALHEELFNAVRFERGWQLTATEGLPPAALEIEPLMRRPFALLRHWRLMRATTWVGAHLALGLRAGYLPCAMAPHLGLILATGQRESLGSIQAGRALQRVWLAATAAKLALQPMAAPTALAWQRPGNGWVSARVRTCLEELLKELCRGEEAQPYLLFRLGQADAPTTTTTRLPLDHYTQ